jgi:hypothetical protein
MKIVIWGHKLHSHTHSYIHYGYWRAAEALGHDVSWYDDNDDITGVDFSDSIFITEHQVCFRLPLREDCTYFIHNSDEPFKFERRASYSGLNVINFVHDAKYWHYGQDYIWPSVETIGGSYYNDETKTFVTKWATDLLPDEIDSCPIQPYDETLSDVYFVGSIQGENIGKFSSIIESNGKRFVNIGGYSGMNSIYTGNPPDINQNIEYVRDSYISFDVREKPFFDMGKYYPCRIFKSISYGKWCGSNMPELQDVFGDYVTFDNNLETLYDRIVEDYKNCSEEKMREAMDFVRDNHTYINRLNDMLSLV